MRRFFSKRSQGRSDLSQDEKNTEKNRKSVFGSWKKKCDSKSKKVLSMSEAPAESHNASEVYEMYEEINKAPEISSEVNEIPTVVPEQKSPEPKEEKVYKNELLNSYMTQLKSEQQETMTKKLQIESKCSLDSEINELDEILSGLKAQQCKSRSGSTQSNTDHSIDSALTVSRKNSERNVPESGVERIKKEQPPLNLNRKQSEKIKVLSEVLLSSPSGIFSDLNQTQSPTIRRTTNSMVYADSARNKRRSKQILKGDAWNMVEDSDDTQSNYPPCPKNKAETTGYSIASAKISKASFRPMENERIFVFPPEHSPDREGKKFHGRKTMNFSSNDDTTQGRKEAIRNDNKKIEPMKLEKMNDLQANVKRSHSEFTELSQNEMNERPHQKVNLKEVENESETLKDEINQGKSRTVSFNVIAKSESLPKFNAKSTQDFNKLPNKTILTPKNEELMSCIEDLMAREDDFDQLKSLNTIPVVNDKLSFLRSEITKEMNKTATIQIMKDLVERTKSIKLKLCEQIQTEFSGTPPPKPAPRKESYGRPLSLNSPNIINNYNESTSIVGKREKFVEKIAPTINDGSMKIEDSSSESTKLSQTKKNQKMHHKAYMKHVKNESETLKEELKQRKSRTESFKLFAKSKALRKSGAKSMQDFNKLSNETALTPENKELISCIEDLIAIEDDFDKLKSVNTIPVVNDKHSLVRSEMYEETDKSQSIQIMKDLQNSKDIKLTRSVQVMTESLGTPPPLPSPKKESYGLSLSVTSPNLVNTNDDGYSVMGKSERFVEKIVPKTHGESLSRTSTNEWSNIRTKSSTLDQSDEIVIKPKTKRIADKSELNNRSESNDNSTQIEDEIKTFFTSPSRPVSSVEYDADSIKTLQPPESVDSDDESEEQIQKLQEKLEKLKSRRLKRVQSKMSVTNDMSLDNCDSITSMDSINAKTSDMQQSLSEDASPAVHTQSPLLPPMATPKLAPPTKLLVPPVRSNIGNSRSTEDISGNSLLDNESDTSLKLSRINSEPVIVNNCAAVSNLLESIKVGKKLKKVSEETLKKPNTPQTDVKGSLSACSILQMALEARREALVDDDEEENDIHDSDWDD